MGTVGQVWELDTGIALYRYSVDMFAGSADWLDDDRILVGSIIFPYWETTADLIAYAKACCLVRELTSEERELFGLPPLPAP